MRQRPTEISHAGIRLVVLLTAALAAGGCAHSYVDAVGNTHVIGLVHMVVPKGADPEAGTILRVRSAGLSFFSSPVRSSVTLGFNDDMVVMVRPDSCVAIDPAFWQLNQSALVPAGSLFPRSKQ